MNIKEIAERISIIPIEEIINDLLPGIKLIPEPNQYNENIKKMDCIFDSYDLEPTFYIDEQYFFCFNCGIRGSQYDFVRQFPFPYTGENDFHPEKYFLNKLGLKITKENIEKVREAEYERVLEFEEIYVTHIQNHTRLSNKFLHINGTWVDYRELDT